MSSIGNVTEALRQLGKDDGQAFHRLIELLYDELRSLAGRQMLKERPDHTLQPTALVNEAYIKLVGQSQAGWKSRGHFLAAAAQAMQRICVDHARARRAQKRGGKSQCLLLDEIVVVPALPNVDWLDLEQALSRLEQCHPRAAEVVNLRVFGGMSVNDIADFLGITQRSVNRNWTLAQAWLYRALKSGQDTQPSDSHGP